jgi:small conductance mechanosensitive channel
MTAAPPDECFEEPGTLCQWVYDRTDQNESLAKLADWAIDRPLRVVLVLLAAWILSRLARRWVQRVVARVAAPTESATDRLERLGIDLTDTLGPVERDPRRQSRAQSISLVLTSTVVVSIWTIAALMILGIVGIQLGPLLAGAGIAGVALGFGAQSLVKDCIAGLFMLIEDQYGVGDVVDLGEAVGVVEEVTLRTTVLRGIDGTVWHVPNGVVQRVGNRSQLWSVALLDVDVAYETDLGRARELLHQAAAEVCESDQFSDAVIEPPTVLGVEALGADGVTLRLTVRVEPGTQWDLQRALREHIKSVYDSAGIEIPFPQRTVWMRAEPESSS